MPTARNNLAVAASGTKLFAVGGNGGDYNQLEIYESATDSWSAAAPMPTARHNFAAAIVGNTLLALGGDGPLDVAEAYDIEGGSWSTAEPMGTARVSFAAVAAPSAVVAPPPPEVEVCVTRLACSSPPLIFFD